MDLLSKLFGKAKDFVSEILTGKKSEDKIISPIPETQLKIEDIRNKFANENPDLYKEKTQFSQYLFNKAEEYKNKGKETEYKIYKNISDYLLKKPTLGKENETIYDDYYKKELNKNVLEDLYPTLSKKLSTSNNPLKDVILYKLNDKLVTSQEDFAKTHKELFPQDQEANQDIFDRIALWANKNVVEPAFKDPLNVLLDTVKGVGKGLASLPYNAINAVGQGLYVYHLGVAKINEALGLKQQAQMSTEQAKQVLQSSELVSNVLGLKPLAQTAEKALPYKTGVGTFLGEVAGFMALDGLPKIFNFIGEAGKVAEVAKGVEEAGKAEEVVKNLNIVQRVMRNLVPATRRSLGLYAQTQLLRPASEIEQQNKELQQGVFGVKKRAEKAAEDVAAFTAMEVALPIIGSGLKKVFAPIIDKFGSGGANLLRKQTEKIVNETVDANEKSVSQLVQTGKEQLNKVVKEEVPKQMLSGNISTSVAGMIYDKAPQEVKTFIEEKFPFLFPKNVPDKLGQATHDLLVSIHQGIENGNEDTIKASWDVFKKNIAKDGLFVKNEEEVFKKLVDYVNEGSSLAKEFLQTHTAQEGSLEANSLIKKLYPDITSKELSQMSKYAERILGKASDDQDIEKGFSKFVQKFELNEDELTSFFSKNNYTTKEDILSAFGGGTSTDYKVRLDELKKQVDKLKVPEIQFTNAPETLTQGGIVGKLGLDKYTDVSTLQRITRIPLDKEADFLTEESIYKGANKKYLQSKDNVLNKVSELKVGTKKFTDIVEDEKGQKKFFVQDIFDNIMGMIKTMNIALPSKLSPTLVDRENELYDAAISSKNIQEFLKKVSGIKEEVKNTILKKEGITDVINYFTTAKVKNALEKEGAEGLSKTLSGFMGGTGFQFSSGSDVSSMFREKLKVVTEFIPTAINSVFDKYAAVSSEIGDKYFADGTFYKELEKIAKESGAKTNLELLDYIKNNPNLSSQFKDLASNHIITFESLRKFINDFNTFVGKKEISEIVGYVPHKMSDFLRESIESFYELYGGKELSATAKFTKERILKDIGVGGFFSDNPKEVIESYRRTLNNIVNRNLLNFSFERNIVSAKLPQSMAFVQKKLEQRFYGKGFERIQPSKYVADMLKKIPAMTKSIALSEEEVNGIKSVIEQSQDPALKSSLTDLINSPYIKDLNLLGKSITVLSRVADLPFDIGYLIGKALFLNPNFTAIALTKKIPLGGMIGTSLWDTAVGYLKGTKLWVSDFLGMASTDEKLLKEQLKMMRVLTQDREVDTFIKRIFQPFFDRLDEFGGYVSYFKGDSFLNNFSKNVSSKEGKEFIEKNRELLIQGMSTMINITTGGMESAPSKTGYFINSVMAFKNYLFNLLGIMTGLAKSYFSDEEATKFAQTWVSTMSGGTAPAELVEAYKKMRFGSSGAKIKDMIKVGSSFVAMAYMFNGIMSLLHSAANFSHYVLTGQDPNKLKAGQPNIYKGAEKAFPLHWIEEVVGTPYIVSFYNDFYLPLFNGLGNFGKALASGDKGAIDQSFFDIASAFDKGLTPEIIKRIDDVFFLSKYKEIPSRTYQPSAKSFLEILSGQEPRPLQTQYSYEGNPLYALFGRSALPEYKMVEEGIKLQEDLKKDREDLKRAYLEQYNNPLNDEKKQQYERLKNRFEQKYNTTVEKKTIVNWLKGAEQTASERVLKTLPKGTKQQLRQKMSLEELLQIQ